MVADQLDTLLDARIKNKSVAEAPRLETGRTVDRWAWKWTELGIQYREGEFEMARSSVIVLLLVCLGSVVAGHAVYNSSAPFVVEDEDALLTVVS